MQAPTLLDCIFQEATNTYYVVDVLAWNGCQLDDCTLECRLAFWVHSKLAELTQATGQEHALSALPFAPCSKGMLFGVTQSWGQWPFGPREHLLMICDSLPAGEHAGAANARQSDVYGESTTAASSG